MGQGSAVAATTGIRRVLRVLRPVAILGGFVVMWWLLATGAAQADAGPRHDGGSKSRPITGTVERVVHQPADRLADRASGRARQHTSAPPKAVRTVRHHTAPAIATTRTTVRSTPVAPIVDAGSDTARDGVKKAVERTRKVLDTAAVGGSVIPEIEGVPDVIETPSLVGESSALQGETRTSHSADAAAEPSTFLREIGPLASLTATSGTALAGQQQAAPSSPVGGGLQGPALHPSGATAASSVQSASGPGSGAGLYEAGLDIMLLATKTPISSHADWLPAGPAYAPTSTPD